MRVEAGVHPVRARDHRRSPRRGVRGAGRDLVVRRPGKPGEAASEAEVVRAGLPVRHGLERTARERGEERPGVEAAGEREADPATVGGETARRVLQPGGYRPGMIAVAAGAIAEMPGGLEAGAATGLEDEDRRGWEDRDAVDERAVAPDALEDEKRRRRLRVEPPLEARVGEQRDHLRRERETIPV